MSMQLMHSHPGARTKVLFRLALDVMEHWWPPRMLQHTRSRPLSNVLPAVPELSVGTTILPAWTV